MNWLVFILGGLVVLSAAAYLTRLSARRRYIKGSPPGHHLASGSARSAATRQRDQHDREGWNRSPEAGPTASQRRDRQRSIGDMGDLPDLRQAHGPSDAARKPEQAYSLPSSEELGGNLHPEPSSKGLLNAPVPIPEGSASLQPVTDLRPGSSRQIAWLKAVQGIVLDVLLTRDEAVIGRDRQCNIVLDEETVSRKHCVLLFRSGRWFIRPFRTPNGTYVNDLLVKPDVLTQLKSRDSIGLGPDIVLRITMPQSELIPVQLRTGAASSAGGRDSNQDSYLVTPTVIGVADGVGGRPAGGLASKIAIDMLRGASDSLSLSHVVPAINAAIRARGADDRTAENMATTLDAAQLVRDGERYRMSGVHIGDGVAIVDDGTQLKQITTPHTLGAELAREGNPASAHHPERTALVRAIGLQENADVDVWSEAARPGSRFVLSTDGLVNALGFKRFFRSLERMRGDSPQHAADTIISYALRSSRDSAEGLDNLTIVVSDIVEWVEEEQPTGSGGSARSAAGAISGEPLASLPAVSGRARG